MPKNNIAYGFAAYNRVNTVKVTHGQSNWFRKNLAEL
jgi:hypothetical protein